MRHSAWAAGLIVALIAALPAPGAGREAPEPNSIDVKALLAGPREAIEKADYRAAGHLVRVDGAGKRTSDDISIKAHWFPGVLRILVEMTAPANAREHVLLEMRPDGQSSIRIARPGDKAATLLPFEKWSEGPLGPGFSYEDFLEHQYFWQGQAMLESVRRGARDCDVLKSTPGSGDKTHDAEVKTWLDHTIDFPVYAEKTPKSSGAVKEFTYFGLRKDDGVWSATQIEEKTRGQAGSTLLIINRGSPKANLNLGDFSPERMTHF
jgi:Outer membrane lipoprotein-sorting protein